MSAPPQRYWIPAPEPGVNAVITIFGNGGINAGFYLGKGMLLFLRKFLFLGVNINNIFSSAGISEAVHHFLLQVPSYQPSVA
jgi:hypothetical protein